MASGSNEVRITMRGSDTEVQDQMAALQAKVVDLTGKMKENARVSRQASKESAEGMKEFKGTLLDVNDTITKIGQGMLALFSVSTIKEYVSALIEEEKRLRDRVRNQSLTLDQSIFLTGDGANAQRVFETVQGAKSSIALEERAGVFQAIRDAAPGLNLETALSITQGTLEGPGQISSSADLSGKIGADAARLAFIGQLDAETALNVATRANQAQGGRDVVPLVTDAVQKAVGLSPQEDRRELTDLLLGVAVTGGQQGVMTRQLRSVLDQAGSDYDSRLNQAAATFRREGFGEAEALEAARAQVGPLALGRDIERALAGDPTIFQQQNFRNAQGFFRGLNRDLLEKNLETFRSGAPGTIENALAARQEITRGQIEVDVLDQELDVLRGQARELAIERNLQNRADIERRFNESNMGLGARLDRRLSQLGAFGEGVVTGVVPELADPNNNINRLAEGIRVEVDINFSTDQFGTVDIDEQLPPQEGN